MKKLLALALALCMLFAMTACGAQTPAPAPAAPAAPAAEAPAAPAEAKDYIECEPMALTYTCSATDNTCWADMGRQFGQYLSDRTNGAITVTVYAADQLANGNQTEGIQSVIDGAVDMSAHSNLILSNFDQRLNVVSLPFIFDNTEEVDAILDGDGLKALAPIVEGLGLHLLGVAENGFRHVTNNVRPINTLEDMQGLKIRVAGASVLKDAYAAWGTNYTTANWSEVYTGLQTGTYEGQENPLPTADGGSIADVQNHCLYWTGVYDCIFFTINADLYESLSPELQQLFDEAGAWAAAQQRVLEREGDQVVLEKWKGMGIEVTELSDEEVVKFKEAAKGVPAKFIETCVGLGFDEAEVTEIVNTFTK